MKGPREQPEEPRTSRQNSFIFIVILATTVQTGVLQVGPLVA